MRKPAADVATCITVLQSPASGLYVSQEVLMIIQVLPVNYSWLLLHACQSLGRHAMHAWGAYHRASAIHHDANVHALLPGLKVPYDRLHATGPHT